MKCSSCVCMKSVGFAPQPSSGWALLPAPNTHTGTSYTQGRIFIYRAAVQGIQTLAQEKGASLLQGTAAVGRTHHPGKGHHSPHGEGPCPPRRSACTSSALQESPQKIRLENSVCFPFCPAPAQSSEVGLSVQRWVLSTGATALTREDGILDLHLTWKTRTRWPLLAAELGEAGDQARG